MVDVIKLSTVYMIYRTDKPYNDGTDIYVGSTSQSLKKRMCCHRATAKNPAKRGNIRLYKRIVEVGIGNWKTFHLLSRTCDKKEALELERKWISILRAGLNMKLPIKVEESKKEYHKKKWADWYVKNKEHKKEYNTSYYKTKTLRKKNYAPKLL